MQVKIKIREFVQQNMAPSVREDGLQIGLTAGSLNGPLQDRMVISSQASPKGVEGSETNRSSLNSSEQGETDMNARLPLRKVI